MGGHSPIIIDKLDAAMAEIERLRRLITWCAPRLRKDEYAISLWEQLDNPHKPDNTPVVLSNKSST